jgi:hypothetical protein
MQLLKNNVAKGCAKRRHASAVEARVHIMKLAKKHNIPFGSYYECDICGGFHVTRQPPNGMFRRL